MSTVLADLESQLTVLLQMPQNRGRLRGNTPQDAAHAWVQQIRRGFLQPPKLVEVRGSARFLRGVGAAQNPYGNWWFEEQLLWKLQTRLATWPFPEEHRHAIVERQLRDGLAVSRDWNPLSELWCLELPAGDKLNGLVGITSPQLVISDVHDPQYDATWELRGGETQYFFPIINPLWVRRHT